MIHKFIHNDNHKWDRWLDPLLFGVPWMWLRSLKDFLCLICCLAVNQTVFWTRLEKTWDEHQILSKN